MNTNFNFKGFTSIEATEAALVLGGVDKRAQDALYTIGYILGVIVRLFATLFSSKEKSL